MKVTNEIKFSAQNPINYVNKDAAYSSVEKNNTHNVRQENPPKHFESQTNEENEHIVCAWHMYAVFHASICCTV